MFNYLNYLKVGFFSLRARGIWGHPGVIRSAGKRNQGDCSNPGWFSASNFWNFRPRSSGRFNFIVVINLYFQIHT
jgi:hypothetical protein